MNLFLSFSFLSILFCCHSLHDLIQYHVYKHYLYVSDFQIRPVQISSLNFRLMYPDAYMTSLCTYLVGGSGLPGPKHLISPPPPKCLPDSPSSQRMVTPSLRLFRPKIATPFSPTPYTQFVRKSFSFIFQIHPELIACYTSTATQLFLQHHHLSPERLQKPPNWFLCFHLPIHCLVLSLGKPIENKADFVFFLLKIF